ncbi:menaquinone biosynthesis methyltransferase ubiE [Corynebacterium otitidis ATCC 51513]|uniref:Demethylmenaquinone methyltransferase n=1 Tax=Corynebacterium otitidis ATCC 51513 TaxID=883169 RepID=I7JWU7_9CORY|nr:menaquinone biosynthesis methyltransferase ubiE [Corynebacterium otitidis ATCC 51513]CCI84121.1 phosphatidylinositol alpha 1,6-mannosyltransferase [Corynebacterium otitidis ATCC 51513]
MRVAIVAESYFPAVNGVSNTVARTVDYLSGRGHDVLLIAPGDEQPGDAANPRVTVRRLPATHVPPVRSLPVGIPLPRLTTWLKDFRPDVVHLASPFVLGAAGAAAAHRLNLPLVAVFQTDVPGFAARYGLAALEKPAWWLTRTIHQGCAVNLAPSTRSLEQLKEQGVPGLARWGRGVDAETFRPERRSNKLRRSWGAGESDVVVGYVGRLAPEKAVHRLSRLCRTPGVRVVVVGKGPERETLEAALPGAVFTGQLRGEKLGEAFASFDVFVHPGEFETFCQTVQEAHASGVPAIAPNRGGPVDLIDDGVDGFLLPVEGFADALPAKVAELTSPERRDSYRKASLAAVEGRDWGSLMAALEEHYATAIQRGPRPRPGALGGLESGPVGRAGLDKEPREVRRMFDGVGGHYDLANTVLSFGQDRRWRRRNTKRLGAAKGELVLDLAAGTGVSTVELAKNGAYAVSCDFSLGMLKAGRGRDVPMVAGDGLNLPFPDETFDAVTISYGLRNLNDPRAGLEEMARVTKPGGRLTVNEFSTPTVPVAGAVYKEYLMRLLPVVARAVATNPEAYVYLAESIRQWPDQEELAALINRSGWADCGWQNLTFGVVAIHSATKPE